MEFNTLAAARSSTIRGRWHASHAHGGSGIDPSQKWQTFIVNNAIGDRFQGPVLTPIEKKAISDRYQGSVLTLVMGAAIHDLSHLAHRCMTSATSHIPLPAYHCSRLCPTSQGWGSLFQQRGMVYPFLNKLLRGCVRWDLQCAQLEVTSGCPKNGRLIS